MKSTRSIERAVRVMEVSAVVGLLVTILIGANVAPPASAMPGEQAAMPKGVIGVSLQVGAERVGAHAVDGNLGVQVQR